MCVSQGIDRRGALLEYFHDTGSAKASAARDYVLDLVARDRKLLVFAHHQQVLDSIEEGAMQQVKTFNAFNMVDTWHFILIFHLSQDVGFIRIDGRTSAEARSRLASRFQTDSQVRVAILSINAANAGLNLTSANVVVFAELYWNPGVRDIKDTSS